MKFAHKMQNGIVNWIGGIWWLVYCLKFLFNQVICISPGARAYEPNQVVGSGTWAIVRDVTSATWFVSIKVYSFPIVNLLRSDFT